MKGSKPTNRELKQQRLLAKEIKKQEKLQLNKDLSQIRRQEYAMTKRQEEAELFKDLGHTTYKDTLGRERLK